MSDQTDAELEKKIKKAIADFKDALQKLGYCGNPIVLRYVYPNADERMRAPNAKPLDWHYDTDDLHFEKVLAKIETAYLRALSPKWREDAIVEFANRVDRMAAEVEELRSDVGALQYDR